MDFASLMKSKIASSTTSANDDRGKKYLRRSDLEAQRQQDYVQEQEQAEQARLDRIEKKRKRDDDEAERQRVSRVKKERLAEEGRLISEAAKREEENEKRRRIGLPPLPEKTSHSGEDLNGLDDVPDAELKDKLRGIGEPVTLFSETHVQRLKRWNDLSNKQSLSKGPIPTTLQLVEEKDMRLVQGLPKSKEERKYVRQQLASYFDLVLTEWARALARRPKDVKDSPAGKQAFNIYTTALSNLTPMYRKLETDSLQDEILKAVIEIAYLAQSKRYVHANDAYLRLSIGNTAWPIGVTMVGIHERSAREKLHEDSTAHIMRDEETRLILQGLKRALTFAQTRWPPDDFAQLMG